MPPSETSPSAAVNSSPAAAKTAAEPDNLPCPRCEATNTKFCYYNNYNLAQPRYFCKSCRRYWTRGGSLRNVPVGGGSRKNNHNHHSSAKRPRAAASTTTPPPQQPPLNTPPPVTPTSILQAPRDYDYDQQLLNNLNPSSLMSLLMSNSNADGPVGPGYGPGFGTGGSDGGGMMMMMDGGDCVGMGWLGAEQMTVGMPAGKTGFGLELEGDY